MTTVDDLLHRVETLEETVDHLTTHHDEQYLMVHDDITADTCDRLFNVNLRQAQEQQSSSSTRTARAAHRKRHTVTTKHTRG